MLDFKSLAADTAVFLARAILLAAVAVSLAWIGYKAVF